LKKKAPSCLAKFYFDMEKTKWMTEAIELSKSNVLKGGGPFGAVIVKDNEIVGRGVNRVTANCDPTAHAEVSAIREASKNLGTFDLSDCEIFTSCEPCPMCLGAIYWARLKSIYYGNTKEDAAKIGFDDQFIYDELDRTIEDRSIQTKQIMPEEANEAFKLWDEKEDKVEY